MEKLGEQDTIGEVAKSNLYQWERGIGGVIGSIDKGRIKSRNNQSDQQIGSFIVEQNICNQEVGRRTEENNGLSTTEYTIEIQIFYNERSEQGIGNMEQGRLSMPIGHQIGVQSCSSNRGVGEIPSLYAQ
ncbi:MAG: hypothetical protein EZS28_054093 [Streblomastix strix]|uniref:Uncharacterized protein n=1 Tax=Streblomastix strix TaxID=222440 RepID=A0A5J4QVW6_9EUKA|nr:MAG: hypothetical protein EZS28_054093 [Streblomastix strix]